MSSCLLVKVSTDERSGWVRLGVFPLPLPCVRMDPNRKLDAREAREAEEEVVVVV